MNKYSQLLKKLGLSAAALALSAALAVDSASAADESPIDETETVEQNVDAETTTEDKTEVLSEEKATEATTEEATSNRIPNNTAVIEVISEGGTTSEATQPEQTDRLYGRTSVSSLLNYDHVYFTHKTSKTGNSEVANVRFYTSGDLESENAYNVSSAGKTDASLTYDELRDLVEEKILEYYDRGFFLEKLDDNPYDEDYSYYFNRIPLSLRDGYTAEESDRFFGNQSNAESEKEDKVDKPAEQKPEAGKQAEQKPAADKQAEQKPAAGKQAEQKPEAGKQAEQKPAADKKAEQKPEAGKKEEEKPEAGKQTEQTDRLLGRTPVPHVNYNHAYFTHRTSDTVGTIFHRIILSFYINGVKQSGDYIQIYSKPNTYGLTYDELRDKVESRIKQYKELGYELAQLDDSPYDDHFSYYFVDADKQAEQKPEAGKQAEQKPAAGKQAEQKPEAGKQAEQKPEAGKQAEQKPAADKQAEQKPEAGKKDSANKAKANQHDSKWGAFGTEENATRYAVGEFYGNGFKELTNLTQAQRGEIEERLGAAKTMAEFEAIVADAKRMNSGQPQSNQAQSGQAQQQKDGQKQEARGERLPDTATGAWALGAVGLSTILAGLGVKKFKKD